MSRSAQLLLWTSGGQRYALPLPAIARVTPALELTPLPEPTPGVRGLFNLHGQIVPVLRWPLHAGGHELGFQQLLILLPYHRRWFALVADTVPGLVTCSPDELVPAPSIAREMPAIQSVLKLADGLVLVPGLPALLAGIATELPVGDPDSEAAKHG